MYLEGEEYLVFSQVYSILRGRSIKYLEGEKDEGSGSIPARQTAGKTIGGRVLLRLNAKVWKQEIDTNNFHLSKSRKSGDFSFWFVKVEVWNSPVASADIIVMEGWGRKG